MGVGLRSCGRMWSLELTLASTRLGHKFMLEMRNLPWLMSKKGMLLFKGLHVDSVSCLTRHSTLDVPRDRILVAHCFFSFLRVRSRHSSPWVGGPPILLRSRESSENLIPIHLWWIYLKCVFLYWFKASNVNPSSNHLKQYML